MKVLKPLNLLRDIRHIHLICRILGLAPYTINTNYVSEEITVDYSIKNNFIASVWSIISTVLLLISNVLLIIHNITYLLNVSATEYVNEFICIPLFTTIAFLALVTNLTINKNKVAEFVNAISQIDNKLNKLNNIPPQVICYKSTPDPDIFIFTLVFVPFYVYDVWVWIIGDIFYKNIAFRYSHVIDLAFILHFCSCLCKCTEEIVSPCLMIPQLRNLLGEICGAARILNSLHGPLILLELLKIFLMIIGNITSLVFMLHSRCFDKALSFILWKLLAIVELVYIVVTCHVTVNKLNKLNHIIHNTLLSRHPLSADMFYQTTAFLHQISTCGLEFMACYLFKLDFTFLCNILASFVTYAVILVQYK
ncbi:hypothetical protein L9F63_001337 [Diploptera punctata]|uniref:Gustatory receptor n=1 Tax=Diploptera punctata TaxID=6984 RepID=A0AAD8EJD7_DIPPU|nr:hypothetical protein L9F63_001337 [Diploptera punctata]